MVGLLKGFSKPNYSMTLCPFILACPAGRLLAWASDCSYFIPQVLSCIFLPEPHCFLPHFFLLWLCLSQLLVLSSSASSSPPVLVAWASTSLRPTQSSSMTPTGTPTMTSRSLPSPLPSCLVNTSLALPSAHPARGSWCLPSRAVAPFCSACGVLLLSNPLPASSNFALTCLCTAETWHLNLPLFCGLLAVPCCLVTAGCPLLSGRLPLALGSAAAGVPLSKGVLCRRRSAELTASGRTRR